MERGRGRGREEGRESAWEDRQRGVYKRPGARASRRWRRAEARSLAKESRDAFGTENELERKKTHLMEHLDNSPNSPQPTRHLRRRRQPRTPHESRGSMHNLQSGKGLDDLGQGSNGGVGSSKSIESDGSLVGGRGSGRVEEGPDLGGDGG